MNTLNYYDESDILTYGTCNFFKYLSNPNMLHMHRQIEIMYVVNGRTEVLLADKTITLTKGDFYMTKPYELHAYHSKRAFASRFVSPILPDYISDRLASRIEHNTVYHDSSGELAEILYLYRTFEPMSTSVRMYYYEMIEKYINSLLTDKDVKETPEANIIRYITEHATDNLTLESVAFACCTNRCTVSKTVNNYSGQNFNSFVNKIRLSLFLEYYVRMRPSNIEKAALSSGFNSPRTFYRVFLSEFGMTPTQYMDKLNNIISNK